ncbi:MAG: Ada metal-binding domain-containing protein [Parcubacteria group bacterium]
MNKPRVFWRAQQNKIVLTLGGILLVTASFGAGRLTVVEKSEPVVIENPVEQICQCPKCAVEEKASANDTEDDEEEGTEQGDYVASKNGTKYYLTSCSGANRIKEENKVWFDSADEAKTEGYEPAKNCQGL